MTPKYLAFAPIDKKTQGCARIWSMRKDFLFIKEKAAVSPKKKFCSER